MVLPSMMLSAIAGTAHVNFLGLFCDKTRCILGRVAAWLTRGAVMPKVTELEKFKASDTPTQLVAAWKDLDVEQVA